MHPISKAVKGSLARNVWGPDRRDARAPAEVVKPYNLLGVDLDLDFLRGLRSDV